MERYIQKQLVSGFLVHSMDNYIVTVAVTALGMSSFSYVVQYCCKTSCWDTGSFHIFPFSSAIFFCSI